jgi:hypothetical protein
MEIPEAIKKQIDNLIDGVVPYELHDRDLPGWFTDSILFHDNGKPIFILSKNIMEFIDLRIFPSMSNLILYGYGRSPSIEEYFEKRVKEKIGMDFDMSYLLDRKTERKYLEALKEITL